MSRFLTSLAFSLAAFAAQAQELPRTDLLAQCPQLADELPELLASAKQRIQQDGDVRAELSIDAKGQGALESIDGPRAYRSATRIALSGLQCPGAASQRYVLNILFDDSPAAVARSAQTRFALVKPR